jgi:uncharacterized membrane protein
MREWLIFLTEQAIILIDVIALAVIVFGTVQALVGGIGMMLHPASGHMRREVWLRYARWLIAGLTFQLAADIIETAITTDWEAIARVGAIAVIRTFLNYFLERDLGETRERQKESAGEHPGLAPMTEGSPVGKALRGQPAQKE